MPPASKSVSKPYDAAIKDLIVRHPRDWLRLVGMDRDARLEPEETDLGSVSPQADKVFLVRDDRPWLLHMEFQASHDPDFSDRMLLYNVLLYHRRKLPVRSVAVLLRPEADGPRHGEGISGRLVRSAPEAAGESPTIEFGFPVVRVWEMSAAELLRGGTGTLPLAPIADLGGRDPLEVAQAMERRIAEEVPVAERPFVWTSAFLLLGLRHDAATVANFLKGLQAIMHESSTYQMILEEGAAKGRQEGLERGLTLGLAREARRMLLLFGERSLGAPDAASRAAIEAIDDPASLETLALRIDSVRNWKDLLASSPLPRMDS